MDLMRLRCEASLIMHDLVTQTSELKDHMRPCGGSMSMNPQNVLPLGFGNASLRRRRHVKKQGGQVPAAVVAGLYLQKKKMLPSLTSSDHCEDLTREALVKAKEWLVELVALIKEAREWILYLTEESLEAWPEMPYFSEPGAFAARLSQTMPDAFISPSESSPILSDTEAVIGYVLNQ